MPYLVGDDASLVGLPPQRHLAMTGLIRATLCALLACVALADDAPKKACSSTLKVRLLATTLGWLKTNRSRLTSGQSMEIIRMKIPALI